jgi:hypothetical protein
MRDRERVIFDRPQQRHPTARLGQVAREMRTQADQNAEHRHRQARVARAPSAYRPQQRGDNRQGQQGVGVRAGRAGRQPVGAQVLRYVVQVDQHRGGDQATGQSPVDDAEHP